MERFIYFIFKFFYMSNEKEEVAINRDNFDSEKNNLKKGQSSSEDSEKKDENINNVEERKEKENKSLISRFLTKEVFDRIGYGFGSTQFINILFYQTIFLNPLFSNMAFFIIAGVNGLKAILTVLISIGLKEYEKNHQITRKLIGMSGIVFGFSFMFLAIGRFLANYPGYTNFAVPIYITAFLAGSIGVVSYGETYQNMFKKLLKREKRGPVLGKFVRYGLLITVVSLFLGALIIDKVDNLDASYFKEENRDTYLIIEEGQNYPPQVTGGSLWQPKIPFVSQLSSFRIFGYLIVFWIATLALIISGYVLSFFKEEKKVFLTKIKFSTQLKLLIKRVSKHSSELFKNKIILVLLVASSITGLIQILAGTFFGIFIWLNYGNFTNVAIIFVLALLSSLISEYVARIIPRMYGNIPSIVFGTVLLAMGPLSYSYAYYVMSINPKMSIIIAGVGTMIWVMGAAIVGLAKGRLIQNIIPERYRESYFTIFSLMIFVPYLTLIPLGGYLADKVGLHHLFFSLGAILIIFVVPLYVLILLTNKSKI